jgi:DHA1 family multidrug resistance protein-like MFS transporter
MEAIIVYVVFIVTVLFLPETYAPVLLRKKAQKMRKETRDQRYWHPSEGTKVDLRNIATKQLSRPLRYIP